jgi:hypothetical protein
MGPSANSGRLANKASGNRTGHYHHRLTPDVV